MRFEQAEYAEYYHKQMIEGGYPGKLLPFVLKELEGLSTVIDIGSGTGFFSIPLAMAGHRVTAVEPSAQMINIMEKNASNEILSSIEICRMPWENWKGNLHEAAICVHSLYPMPDIKKAVTLINESAEKKILIVRDSACMKTLPGMVRQKLGVNSNRDLNSEIILTLNELSVNWRTVNIYEERKHTITDVREEAGSILFQLKLDKSFREDVFKIVNEAVNYSSGIKFFNAIYSDNAYIF
ncbi:MAG TPA: class I SAM-dependent methyltransferase [Spirochaetota bacterium]|nr:class I SAM-dependent methyltransferase [Spirochaetota bacterium]HPS87197.1 class I SAM-dependent methyltransferase [Spirochaetota bacterium]